MQNWKEKLKRQFDENPIACIAVAGLAIGAVAKLIDSLSAAQGRRAYARQVEYKINHPR